MIFQHTWEKVLSGQKNQTRRIIRVGEIGREGWDYKSHEHCIAFVYKHDDSITSVIPQRLMRYSCGDTYAVQPGRGKKSIGRIEITGIRREDVRQINDEGVRAEGFASKQEFLLIWASMHDRSFFREYSSFWVNTAGLADEKWYERQYQAIFSRPPEYYEAWVLTFKLVSETR